MWRHCRIFQRGSSDSSIFQRSVSERGFSQRGVPERSPSRTARRLSFQYGFTRRDLIGVVFIGLLILLVGWWWRFSSRSIADRPPTHARTNILLITTDALRADHVHCYGNPLETSPTMDALAASGVRFADATVQWPKTWPSIASMMTSLYPASTGIKVSPRRPLPSEHTTMAEIYKNAGYQTAGIVANVNLGSNFGFDQGFDHFVNSWQEEQERQMGQTGGQIAAQDVDRFTNATVVTNQALTLANRFAPDRPYFLWLHYLEPHGPYLPPEKYAPLFTNAYPAQPVRPRTIPGYQRLLDLTTGRPSNDIGYYKAQYDSEIRYLDDELERLLTEFKRRKLLEHTVIVFTSDHGESLDEHGYYLEHGATPYEPTARVPLIVSHPGQIPAGEVVNAPVGLVDVLPTLLEISGVNPPSSLAGRSLLSMIQNQPQQATRPVFMESGTHDGAFQLVVRDGPWKLIHMPSDRDQRRYFAAEFQLFHVVQDPKEEQDRYQDQPEIANRLKTVLAQWRNTTPTYGNASEQPADMALDKNTQEMLKALGYVE